MGAVQGIVVGVVIALGAGLAPGAARAAPCPQPGAQATDARLLTRDGVTLAVRYPDGRIMVGRPFAIEVIACAADGRPLRFARVDAWMPAHGHGMNYRPTVRRLRDGRRRYEGFLFHMPGAWELRVDVASGAARTRFRLPLRIGP